MGRSVSTPREAVVAVYFNATDYEDTGQFDLELLRSRLIARWPSLWRADGWAGREDRIIARNGHALFGVSTYGDLGALWVIPHDNGLARHWVDCIRAKLAHDFADYRRMGTMSNGVSYYERIKK